MAHDGAGAPLSRRVPGAARRGPGQPAKSVLSESVLGRMQAAIDAEHAEQEVKHQDDPNTEPLPRLTALPPPSKRDRRRPLSPSGMGPDVEALPDLAAPVPEPPSREEPMRVARALHIKESEASPGEPQPPSQAGPELLSLAQPSPLAVPEYPAVSDYLAAVSDYPAAPHDPPQSPRAAEPPRVAEPPRPPRDQAAVEYDAGPTPGSIGWLWPEEAALRPGGPRWRPPGRWRYRAVTLVALGAIVLGAAGLVIGMSLHSTPVAAAHRNSTPKATARPTPSAAATPTAAPNSTVDPAVLADAVDWISQQMAPGTVIACDVQTCAALTASGYPTDQEVQLGSYSPTLSNASIVVVTPTLRSYFSTVNPSLGNYVAPAVLASFGPVNIQPIAPAGAAAYANALNQDVQARMQFGEHLLNSGLVSASPAAGNDLATGQVDPRVLLALQAIINTQLPIDVLGFSDSGPGASPGVPFREVTLNGNAQASGLSTKVYLNSMSAVLGAHATFPQFTRAQPVTLSPGVNGVQIEWAAPSPFGSALSASG